MSTAAGPVNSGDLKRLFNGPSGPSRQEVRKWWHHRRMRYNRDLFLVGVVTWILVWVAGSAAVKAGEDFEKPIMMNIGPVFYAGFANAAYTAGPIFDTILFRGSPSRGLFKAGYIFSLVLTAL